MIGFDRSAFAGRPPQGERLKDKDSRERSIHDEGLPEHPIKN
ncbi:MAG TPA: hypothetical protein VFH31_13620 [Pyrinomonadaceae bacterium]|nr:hypothetical protein [Pyrinomonadaceae bacterium]